MVKWLLPPVVLLSCNKRRLLVFFSTGDWTMWKKARKKRRR